MQLTKSTLFILGLYAGGAAAGLVDESMQQADLWWDKTREYADGAWDKTQRLWSDQAEGDARLWQELQPPMDQVLVLKERKRKLPESSWFGEDQESNRQAIAALLDRSSHILVGDNRHRRRMSELELAMADNRSAIAKLKEKRLAAPSDSLWRSTVEDLNEEIAEREEVLDEQAEALTRVRADFAAELKAQGLDIDAEGLDFLFSTVVGDDVLDMAQAFLQVRRLTGQLEALTAESGEDLPIARRYYGMYTVLLGSLEHMHGQLLDAVDQRYLPQIQTIRERAKELRRDTRRLMVEEPSPVLAANLQAQALTLDAARRYADYLKDQRRQVAASAERLSRDMAVAENTYETVKVSGDLLALMQDSQRLLSTLFKLQVPPLRSFENLAMKREFNRLTKQLRSTSGE
jgi:hypothetical protein